MSAGHIFAVVGRRRRSSGGTSLFFVAIFLKSIEWTRSPSPPSSSIVRHFPLSSQGRTCWKKSDFRCFSKTRNLSKIQDFWQNEWTRFFRPSFVVAVVGRRRRPSFPFFVQGTQIFVVFQKLAIFLKFKIFGKMSVRDFFAVAVNGCRPSSPSSVISLFRHRDGPVEKNQIFAVFQKLAIVSKIQDFWQNEWTRFFRRRRSSSPSSVVAVVRHFPLSSQGTDLWKKSNFRCFSKTRNFSKIQDFLVKWVDEIFSPSSSLVVDRPSFPSFVHRDGPVKKIKFSPFLKNSQFF